MTLDPPVERLLELMRSADGGPVGADAVTQMREAERRMVVASALVDGVSTEDVVAGGVPVRLYRPSGAGETRLPLHVYYHGGGFVSGSAFSGGTRLPRPSGAASAEVTGPARRPSPRASRPCAPCR